MRTTAQRLPLQPNNLYILQDQLRNRFMFDDKEGVFITVEGIEGVGKTTNVAFIAGLLAGLEVDCVRTREPGGTPMAEEIRNLLLAPREEAVDGTTELLLMFAARAQHLNTFILPQLAKGSWVLCDRFTDATFAYQGGGRGVPLDRIAQLELFVQGTRKPDHVILLDAPAELGLARAGRRGALDRFEQETVDFFERVRQVYLERAANNPGRYHIVDASAGLETVQAQLAAIVQRIVSATNRTPPSAGD